MRDTRPDPGATAPAAPAETATEALARAGRHARNAVAEALEAVRALLDAAALVTSGVPAESHQLLSAASRTLESLAAGIGGGAGAENVALVNALAEALDAEIARWEARAVGDADARAVLRAFLGLRELLWELGVRRGGTGAHVPDGASRPPARARKRPRVERVPVEG